MSKEREKKRGVVIDITGVFGLPFSSGAGTAVTEAIRAIAVARRVKRMVSIFLGGFFYLEI